MYQPIELDAADQKAMRQLTAEAEALTQFIETMTQAGQNRFASFNQRRKEAFTAFALKYGIDVEKVQWVVSKDGTKLVPMAVRLSDDAVR